MSWWNCTLCLLPGLIYHKYPAFAAALQSRHIVYNQTVEEVTELERQGIIFVIRPKEPLDVGRMETNPDKVQMAYEAGYSDATQQRGRLIEWLGN